MFKLICPFLLLFWTAHKSNVTRNRGTRKNILQSIKYMAIIPLST